MIVHMWWDSLISGGHSVRGLVLSQQLLPAGKYFSVLLWVVEYIPVLWGIKYLDLYVLTSYSVIIDNTSKPGVTNTMPVHQNLELPTQCLYIKWRLIWLVGSAKRVTCFNIQGD